MDPYAIENPDTQRRKARKELIHDGNCSTAARMYAESIGVIKSAAWYAALGHIQVDRIMTALADHENERNRCVFPRQVMRGLNAEMRCKHP